VHSAAGRIRSIIKCNDLIGDRIHDFSASSIVPQPSTPPRAHVFLFKAAFSRTITPNSGYGRKKCPKMNRDPSPHKKRPIIGVIHCFYFGNEGASSSISDVNSYITIRKLLDSILNIFPVFVSRW
jgi:hypothetical protein